MPYLNALPLYRTLENSVRLVRAVPSQLSDYLRRGEVDAALLPVVDAWRDGEIISDACIACTGPVRSVLLFSKVLPRDIKSVAADTSSHTSVALAKIILADAHKVLCVWQSHAPDLEAMLHTHDAALLIGDPALEAASLARRNHWHVLDLGAAWQELTELPFVFAVWTTRNDGDSTQRAQLSALLNQARDDGIRQIARLAHHAHESNHTPLAARDIEDYLTHAIEYRLTDAHRRGLQEFRHRCRAHGLVDE